MNRWRETCQVRRDLIPCPRNDNGSRGLRVHEMRNRVRVMCKPGSVGGRGGQPPRSTRPNFPPTPISLFPCWLHMQKSFNHSNHPRAT